MNSKHVDLNKQYISSSRKHAIEQKHPIFLFQYRFRNRKEEITSELSLEFYC